jgi:hypothetical protein
MPLFSGPPEEVNGPADPATAPRTRSRTRSRRS